MELSATSLYLIYYRRTVANFGFSWKALLEFTLLECYHSMIVWVFYAGPSSTRGYSVWRELELHLVNWPAIKAILTRVWCPPGSDQREWRNYAVADLGIRTLCSVWATANVVLSRLVMCLGWYEHYGSSCKDDGFGERPGCYCGVSSNGLALVGGLIEVTNVWLINRLVFQPKSSTVAWAMHLFNPWFSFFAFLTTTAYTIMANSPFGYM